MSKAKTKMGRPRAARPVGNAGAFARWMDATGMTGASVAKKLGLSKAYVSHLRMGRYKASLDVALRIEALSDGAVPVEIWGSRG